METPQIDIQALGKLARLEFSPEQGEQYTKQLPKLVEYVGQLQAVETDSVAEPQTAIDMRSDVADSSPARDAILSAAPEREGDYWKVKAVF